MTRKEKSYTISMSTHKPYGALSDQQKQSTWTSYHKLFLTKFLTIYVGSSCHRCVIAAYPELGPRALIAYKLSTSLTQPCSHLLTILCRSQKGKK